MVMVIVMMMMTVVILMIVITRSKREQSAQYCAFPGSPENIRKHCKRQKTSNNDVNMRKHWKHVRRSLKVSGIDKSLIFVSVFRQNLTNLSILRFCGIAIWTHLAPGLLQHLRQTLSTNTIYCLQQIQLAAVNKCDLLYDTNTIRCCQEINSLLSKKTITASSITAIQYLKYNSSGKYLRL